MKTLGHFLIQIVANSLSILFCSAYLKGFSFEGDIYLLIKVSFFIALLNFFLKPILKIIFSPLIFLTFGLFLVLINAFILWLASYLFSCLSIQLGLPLVLSSIVFGIINIFIHFLAKILL